MHGTRYVLRHHGWAYLLSGQHEALHHHAMVAKVGGHLRAVQVLHCLV